MACEIPDSLVAGPMPPRRVRLLRDSSGNIIRRGGGLEVSTVQVIDARRLQMMAPRLVELRHVLKPTTSIYLYCDPTASHYLKLLMDAVFGLQHFLNEIV